MFANLCAIFSGALMLISGWVVWSWYAGWLDKYFLWKYLAYLVSVPTAPFAFIALIIEWIWHRFPFTPMLAVGGMVLSVIVITVGGAIARVDANGMAARSNVGMVLGIVVVIVYQAIYWVGHFIK